MGFFGFGKKTPQDPQPAAPAAATSSPIQSQLSAVEALKLGPIFQPSTRSDPDAPMGPFFKRSDFYRSDTATKLGIDNRPTPAAWAELERVAMFAHCLRLAIGKPLIVSSGFRCPALNKAVGGVANSAHQFGLALDLQCPGMSNQALGEAAAALFRAAGMSWDQIIEEKNPSGASWLHVALPASGQYGREQIFSLRPDH